MKQAHTVHLLTLAAFGSLLLHLSGSAEAGMFGFGGDTWQEEVLLHDGRKMVVTRSQTYGGRHEIGQPPPIKEHTISFTLPETDKRITWTSEYGEDIGRTNFLLLAVHVLNGTPYLVTEPNLCLAYNKWGRPNPPYVFFKYDGKVWQRIPLAELPAEFITINVALDIMGREVKHLVELGFVSSETVKKLNDHIDRREVQTILREAYSNAAGGCSEMIRTKDGWEGLGFFKHQPSYEACSKYCERKGVSQQNCPCESFFERR
jgi:hypothetical protein